MPPHHARAPTSCTCRRTVISATLIRWGRRPPAAPHRCCPAPACHACLATPSPACARAQPLLGRARAPVHRIQPVCLLTRPLCADSKRRPPRTQTPQTPCPLRRLPDDVGNTPAAATTLPTPAGSFQGLIGASGDVDCFKCAARAPPGQPAPPSTRAASQPRPAASPAPRLRPAPPPAAHALTAGAPRPARPARPCPPLPPGLRASRPPWRRSRSTWWAGTSTTRSAPTWTPTQHSTPPQAPRRHTSPARPARCPAPCRPSRSRRRCARARSRARARRAPHARAGCGAPLLARARPSGLRWRARPRARALAPRRAPGSPALPHNPHKRPPREWRQGVYTACVRGVGQGANGSVGWTNYGSLGAYRISLNVVGAWFHACLPPVPRSTCVAQRVPAAVAGPGPVLWYTGVAWCGGPRCSAPGCSQ